MVLHLAGDASPPYQGHSSTPVTGFGLVSWEVAYRLAANLGVRLTASTGLTAGRPVIRVADREGAHWGHPFVSLGIESTYNLASR